jgi:hypothetical protein
VPKEEGRAYSRPTTGTGMPLEERFGHAPTGACFQALSSNGNYQFRSGQQPKLREINFVESFSR